MAVAAAALFVLLEFGVRPASAQFFGFGAPPQRQRQAAPPRQGFFPLPFLFGEPTYQQPSIERRPRVRARPAEPREPREARAPSPRRPEVEPAKNVLVFGDSMGDWLAHGLEDAFAEANELGVTRKIRLGAGLIRNDPREHDWVQAIKDASEKADFVVIMTGLGDRHAIRDRIEGKPAPKGRRAKAPEKPGEKPLEAGDPEATPAAEADEEKSGGTHEFRSEKWVERYGKRIDEVIAALKAKRVPVLWVGLPAVRGLKARTEIPFLNDIYRSSAEKAGIVYVDVWEGFVGEDGDFTNVGPDVIGQVRRLRSADGVHFTRPGARKLAHYVDREIKRLLSREQPVALAIPPEAQKAEPTPIGPAPRPLAGPVVALTGGAAPREDALVGERTSEVRVGDPLAISVLIRGEPLPGQPGRADNFVWPRPYVIADNDIADPPILPAATVATRPAAAPPASANTGRRTPNPSAASAIERARVTR